LTILSSDFFTLLDDRKRTQPLWIHKCESTMHGTLLYGFERSGTNYVFWDYLTQPPKFQMIIADIIATTHRSGAISQITASGRHPTGWNW